MLSHRNLIAGAESVSSYLGNTEDDVILAALPLSFDAGFSQLTTAFSVGAQVVLMNYLLPADVVKLCAKHQVTGLTCVPPLWIQIADQNWPPDVGERLRYFANTGGRMPKITLDRLRHNFPLAEPFLMYGLRRIPLDLSRPTRSTSGPIHREGHPRRDTQWSGLMARVAIQVRKGSRPSGCVGGARLLE